MNAIGLAEMGLLPDAVVRVGIRRLLNARLLRQEHGDRLTEFADSLRASPLAIAPESANEQHYEVPAEFFQLVLGPRLKYSASYFLDDQSTLAAAEEAMLRWTCARAEICDGMRILELGCGWGSLTLWIAEEYPASTVTAVSNSNSQREYIEREVARKGLRNVRIITADMRDLETNDRFDRVVSVEMFEHMRNYELLFKRVASWLKPKGKVFVHIFCHRDQPYLFETDGAGNWMGQHFFTGGMMPSEHLFGEFKNDLLVEEQWRVNGLHYWRTCEAWLKNLDRNRARILKRFRQDLSTRESKVHVQRWRMFFMACAELFRFRGGNEWFVAHYRLQPKARHVRVTGGVKAASDLIQRDGKKLMQHG